MANSLPVRQQEYPTAVMQDLTENSMRLTPQANNLNHTIDVKTRCQGLVLNLSFKSIEKITVKLISTDLPDTEYFSVSGETLQKILQEKYGNLASNENLNAVIPFSTVGNLPLSEDFYLKVDIVLFNASNLYYDRIISAFDGAGPIIIKRIDSGVKEIDSSDFDELFFSSAVPDVNYILNGKNVHIPQLLIRNSSTIDGVAKIKLVNNTNYVFSCEVYDIYLVEFPNS